MRFQVVVNSADPHSLCRFWARLLDYRIDHDPDLVRRMLEAGAVTWDDVEDHDGDLRWRAAAACVDPDGHGPRLLFQVPEGLPPKVDANRVHLDLNPPRGDGEAVIRRAVELGATVMWEGSTGPARWVTLTDPEGNQFCVTR
ncbi:MAG: VOC family protein [Ilumatobacteraceae bacterium]